MQNKRDFKGIWIPKEIWLDDNLTIMEKVFLVEIDSLDNESGCFASNKYFSEFFGLTNARCSQIINQLIQKKYVSVIYIYNGTEVKKRVLKIFNRVLRKCKKGIKKMQKGYKEKFIVNNTYNNTINNIYIYWNTLNIYKHRNLTDKTRRKIQSTLKLYSEDEIKKACKNYADIVNDDRYYFNYKWTLHDFLQRGIDKFLNRDIAHKNYIDKTQDTSTDDFLKIIENKEVKCSQMLENKI
jgi:hypothetical protein